MQGLIKCGTAHTNPFRNKKHMVVSKNFLQKLFTYKPYVVVAILSTCSLTLLLEVNARQASLINTSSENIITKPTDKECVILLHGLGRTNSSLSKMAEALIERGFVIANIDYPSRKKTIEQLAYEAVPEGVAICQKANASRIHFVTHSMGGIVVRYYLAQETLKNLGRVVMLSPPNQGSLLVDEIADWDMYKWFNGPAGQQLGTGVDSIPLSLGPVSYETGIITGNIHSFFDAWAAEIIPREDDGKVSIDHAKVAGMADFLVLPHAHTFIMNKAEVIRQTLFFLLNGRFDHSTSLPSQQDIK